MDDLFSSFLIFVQEKPYKQELKNFKNKSSKSDDDFQAIVTIN